MRPPEAFLSREKERLGSDFPAFLASYDTPPEKAVRVNTLKISPEEFEKRAPFPLNGNVEGERAGFYVGEEKFGADPYHAAGLYYVQEPSAMTVGRAAPLPKRRVLDLCAAPGGKTTHLAARMAGEGILVSNEIVYSRAKILSQNVERMGICNCAVVSAPPERLSRLLPAVFDLVVVDAPCSGEGMFKKEPAALREWSEENVRGCALRQEGILEEAVRLLAPGGHIVYSTCTFAEEEDEGQIENFLARHGDFALLREEKLYPHTFRGEGHFCAVLENRSASSLATEGAPPTLPSPLRYKGGGMRGESCPPPASGKGQPIASCPPPASGVGEGVRPLPPVKPFPVHRNAQAERAFRAFEEDFAETPFPGAIHTLADGRMFLVPRGMPDFSGVSILRLGVELGSWDGKLFKPAHALAMAAGHSARRKLSLTREEAKNYLRGETMEADLPDGWCTVCVEDFPMGLGKCVGHVVKNHLPKGLRA